VTFLAVGTTGVGKTQTALAVSEALKISDPNVGFVRLDMCEYQEAHRVSQLFGAPPGYVGYGDRTALIDTLIDHPRTVVLFDEIEKAHSSVIQSLMNAMDAGRIALAAPRAQTCEVDCCRAVFFFTSNLMADAILDDMAGKDAYNNPALIDEICRKHFRASGVAPELVGRIRHFIVFRPLSLDARSEILSLAVTRIAEEYGLAIRRIAPGALLSLLSQSGDTSYGARPDEYLVDRMLGDCFAEAASLHAGSPVELLNQPFRCVSIPNHQESPS
jgi:ATP-dependent Clp protease ATP-binding subunit ClpA